MTMPSIEIADAVTRHHLLRPQDVDRVCAQSHRYTGLVAGFIAHRSISMLIGDSGLGKSPLAYQLALCVAGGIPFLGMPTEQGPVIYADFENNLEDGRDMRNGLCKFLGLPQTPEHFYLWSPASDPSGGLNLEATCTDLRPAFCIIDSLRSYDPAFEKADHAGERMNSLHKAAHRGGAAILAIHHIRKPDQEGTPSLDGEDTVLMQWLNQASGARAIINQSDSRIGADLPKRGRGGDMVFKWFRRTHGEGGPLYLERVFDDENSPVGYRLAIGVELLGNPAQEQAFEKLPQEFRFREAVKIYGRSDDPTSKWPKRCVAVGILEQVARGTYRKRVRLPETVE
jgi:AAA domain-containing protein